MGNRLVEATDDRLLSDYYTANRDHLRAWEPARDPAFYTQAFWSERLAEWEASRYAGEAAHFVSTTGNEESVLAVCSITNIARGPFQACNIGYSVAERAEGTGTMKSLLTFAIDYAFNELELHRIMANYMPGNTRSARLLASLGFTEEGLAKSYLLINGHWEDHVLTSLLNPSSP